MRVGGVVTVRIPAAYAGGSWESHEPEAIAALADWMRRRPGAIVLDAGCSVGMFSAVALFADPEAEVIAFDSSPQRYVKLQPARNRTRIAAHYDLPDNLAVVAAGQRRFTLFPPEQIHNLYLGPLDPTPAGQPVSLVDFSQPDLQRFPRFTQALEAAEVADMAPGDALYIPSMWFHHVEGLAPVNLLINAWWRQTPEYVDSPLSTLRLALMTLRDLPEKERRIWQRHFQHFVFEADAHTWEHIPEAARGLLGPIDDTLSRQARTQLLNQLKR